MDASVRHGSSCEGRPFCDAGKVFAVQSSHRSLPRSPAPFHRTLHPFPEEAWDLSSRVLCLGKYAAPCLPPFLSLSQILTVIPFPSLFSALPHAPVACVKIWRIYLGPVVFGKACSFP